MYLHLSQVVNYIWKKTSINWIIVVPQIKHIGRAISREAVIYERSTSDSSSANTLNCIIPLLPCSTDVKISTALAFHIMTLKKIKNIALGRDEITVVACKPPYLTLWASTRRWPNAGLIKCNNTNVVNSGQKFNQLGEISTTQSALFLIELWCCPSLRTSLRIAVSHCNW